MIIYLARHGQTTGDVEDRYGGDYDDHLTEEGRQQSAQLAEQLAGKGIEKLYVSPRIRAQETGAIVGEKLKLEPEVYEDFRERNGYGVLTGLTKAEAKERYPELVELVKDPHHAVTGAEEYAPFQQRITEALAQAANDPHEVIAIITHGGPTRLIYRDILGLGEIDINDCAYAVIEFIDDTYRLKEAVGITIRG